MVDSVLPAFRGTGHVAAGYSVSDLVTWNDEQVPRPKSRTRQPANKVGVWIGFTHDGGSG